MMSYLSESGLGVNLKGQVVSDRGLAAAELLTLREQVQTIVQEPLWPGSLNIMLNRPARLLDAAGSVFDFEYRTLWRASLGGINVWVYRWRESARHIVEILFPVHLRERLNLKNGDTVALRIRKQQIGKIYFMERSVWATKERPAVRRTSAIILYIMKEIVAICRKSLSESSPKNGWLPRKE